MTAVENWEGTDLAARAARGDREAFGQLYDLYVDRVYRYIYYRLDNVRDAEDLAEQVFLNAWRAMPRFRADETPVLPG